MNDIEKMKEIIFHSLMERFVEVEASGRHIHLDKKTKEQLFGKNYQLTKVRDLSQPGQFVCKERVSIIGPKGVLNNVVILGPERNHAQVEISMTDSVLLGVKPPVRESGHLTGTPGITIRSEFNEVHLQTGLIVAKRHIHMTPEDADKRGLEDREIVQVKVYGSRPLIFDDVVVRVSENYRTYMHIDFDEANACGFVKGTLGEIIKKVTPKGE